MPNHFKSYSAGLNQPATAAGTIVPSDTVQLPNITLSLYVGTAGNIKVTTMDGSVVTFNAVPVGVFSVRVVQVWATGTTATNMVALY